MTQDNKTYQITCFFSPALDKEKLDKQIKEIEELINKQEGSIPDKDLLSRTEKKPLAYPIEKNQEAFYLSFGFSLPSENLDKIYAYLNSEENILRHLITIKQEIKTQPTKKPIDFKIVDKIEPLKEIPTAKKEKKPASPAGREKVKIEELDKKLEEILK